MRKRLLLLALVLLVAVWACDSSNPVAPGGTVLTVSASPTLIGLSGESSEITVTGFRPDGNPLNPGTQITLSTSLGTLQETTISVDNQGRATTNLTGNGRQGDAMVTVTTPGSSAMATVMVQIGDSDTTRPQVTVTATPSTVSLNEPSTVSVVVRNSDGSTFTGTGTIQLETTLGELTDTSLALDSGSNGRASTLLMSQDQVGTATVTAFFGSATPATADITIENQQPSLLVTVNPNDVATNGDARVTVLARDENNLPIANAQVQLFADLGSFPPDGASALATTNSAGVAERDYNAGPLGGTATITAVLGSSDPATETINIRSTVGEFSFTSDITQVDRPSSTGSTTPVRFTAIVTDTQGRPAAGQIVVVTAQAGSFTLPGGGASSGNLTTNSSGIAELVWSATGQELNGLDTVRITGSVPNENAPDPIDIFITIENP